MSITQSSCRYNFTSAPCGPLSCLGQRYKPSSVMTKYAFISIQGGQTVREKELAISQAKSHAARAAHRTKKLILLSAGKPEKTAQPEDNQVATQTPAADPSPWHWSKGARRDPFNCIPGSDSVTAGIAIDFSTSSGNLLCCLILTCL